MELHIRNVSTTYPNGTQALKESSVDSRWRDPEPPAREGRDRFHVAINMDGNGRWALLRGRPREAGHVVGASAVRRTVEAAPALGITTLARDGLLAAAGRFAQGTSPTHEAFERSLYEAIHAPTGTRDVDL